MKKTYTLLLLPLLVLGGCAKTTHELTLSVMTPSGAPSVAFYNYATDAKFNTNNNVTTINGFMNNGDYDVIVIDTTSGIKAIEAGAPYKIAATITTGNFYLASTSAANNSLDADDTIVLFGNANAVPYKIFSYIFSDFVSKVEFCGGGVDKAAGVLETGVNTATGHNADWVFIAEPYLYGAKHNATSILYNKDYPVINIQEKYREKTTNLPLMQASLFVKNTADKEEAKKLLNNLKGDIQKGIKTPSKIKEGIDKIDDPSLRETKFGRPSDEIEAVMQYNGLGLNYLSAMENKEAIDTFLSLFGFGVTSEEIYF